MEFKIKQLVRPAITIRSLLLIILGIWAGNIGHTNTFRLELTQMAMAKSKSAKSETAQTTQNPKLNELEQRLFFQNFSSEDEITRLNRIENQVFGQTSTGDTAERLSRIEAALPPIEKPAEQANTTAPPETPTYHAPQPETNDAADDAAERERMAVMAATQEQVANLLNEGVRLWKAKQGDQAIDKFQQVIRLDSQNGQAYFSLGVAYEAKGAFDQADQCYRAALAIDPNNKDCAEALKAIHKKLAVRQSVDAQQAQLRNLADDAAKAYQSGELLSALDLYKQLDDKAPKQALIKWNIGTIYLLLKNPYSALDYYKQASKLKPDEQRYAQAVAQLEQNLKRKEAQENQEQASYSQTQPPANVRPQPNLPMNPRPPQGNMPVNRPTSMGVQPGMPVNQPVSMGSQPGMPVNQPMNMGTQPNMPVNQPMNMGTQPSMPANQPMNMGTQPNMPVNVPTNARQQPTGPPTFAASPPTNMPGVKPGKAPDPLQFYGLSVKASKEGARVTSIALGSRGAQVGLQVGDLIKAVDGTVVSSGNEINQILLSKPPGQRFQFTIQREKRLGPILF
jgi:tetratricopeptide (TPR) repeat protein